MIPLSFIMYYDSKAPHNGGPFGTERSNKQLKMTSVWTETNISLEIVILGHINWDIFDLANQLIPLSVIPLSGSLTQPYLKFSNTKC
jgi:hypothetical protein